MTACRSRLKNVIFSFLAFKKNNPQLSIYYRHVRDAEVTGDGEDHVHFFDGPGNRELPLIVGQLTIVRETLVGGRRGQIGYAA